MGTESEVGKESKGGTARLEVGILLWLPNGEIWGFRGYTTRRERDAHEHDHLGRVWVLHRSDWDERNERK